MEIYLTINETSAETGVPGYTLRYWEKMFPGVLVPLRTKGNQRRYCSNDIKKVLQIKKLLKEDLYSIAGARNILEKNMDKKPL